MAIAARWVLGLMLWLLCLLPGVQAATVECQGVLLKSVVVEGNRDDGFYFQNRLVLHLETLCGDKNYADFTLDNPAFSGFLSVALAAKSAAKRVDIAVNTSTATPISYQLAYIALAE